jgi:hypothetical protein
LTYQRGRVIPRTPPPCLKTTVAWRVAEFEQLTQQAGRHRRQRIDVQPGRIGWSYYFIGHAQQAFVAAAKKNPHNRNLPQHIVELIKRHERAAQMHLVADVIDLPVDGGTDVALHDALADFESTWHAGEFCPHAGEFHALALAVICRCAGNHALERRFASNREIADTEQALLRPRATRWRVHRHPHSPAVHARITISETK